MGNSTMKISETIKNEGMNEPSSNIDDQSWKDQLNLILQKSLSVLENNFRIDVSEFNEGFINFQQGENFEGKLNADEEVQGMGRFYSYNEDMMYSDVHYGALAKRQARSVYSDNGNGNPDQSPMQFIGPGIHLRIKGTINSHNRTINREELSITYLEDWGSDAPQRGVMRQEKNGRQTLFVGKFRIRDQEPEYQEGNLKILEDGVLSLEYEGEFKYNNFHGDGELRIPGKLFYKGEFNKNNRDGLGCEEDYEKKTIYTGRFDNDRRHGFGEVKYLNREGVKLRGFWTDGFVRGGDGVYCTAEGRFMEEVTDEYVII